VGSLGRRIHQPLRFLAQAHQGIHNHYHGISLLDGIKERGNLLSKHRAKFVIGIEILLGK
jgi:hypothetical protein